MTAARSDGQAVKAGFCKTLDVRVRYEFRPLAQPELPVLEDGVQWDGYLRLIDCGVGYQYQEEWQPVGG